MTQPFTTLHLDTAALRVLAHPLRSRLLTALRTDGPATATALARALDTNTGATSYHLRRLASVDLVEETDAGRGRERWWRAATQSHGWTERDVAGDREAEAASDWLRRHYLRSFVERYEAWLDESSTWPLDWRAAAESGDAMLRVTPEQLSAFEDELLALVDRYRDPSPGDPAARRVEFFYHAIPHAEVDR
jgi:predicted ArsR family transcriptional regulator